MEEKVGDWPRVSVFVAARNEERHLATCIEALMVQEYPGESEIWIADDHSEDHTWLIAKELKSRFQNIFIIQTDEPVNGVQGKALALGLMAGKAKGDIFLICDADMAMPPGWMANMVSYLKSGKADLINGTTSTRGNSVFEAWQAIDWLIPQATFAWMSRLGISYTAMGNNMAISRKAYESTGGYLQLPFSLTEDFELFRHARNNGFHLHHLYDEKVLGHSTPQHGFRDWVEQHIRWMIGFFQLPFRQQWVFYAQMLFYPLLIPGWAFFPDTAGAFLGWIWVARYLYVASSLIYIGKWKLLFVQPWYELTFWPAYLIVWGSFLRKKEVKWKGRTWNLHGDPSNLKKN